MKLAFLLILFFGADSADFDKKEQEFSNCASQSSVSGDCIVDDSLTLVQSTDGTGADDVIYKAIRQHGEDEMADAVAEDSEDVSTTVRNEGDIEPEFSMCDITTLKAPSGMLVSQILRRSLAQCGYSLSYLAKYDCRLLSSAGIQGESYQEVLTIFLRSFSLAVKISPVNKAATVVASRSSAHVCTPQNYNILVEEEGP